MHCSVVSVLHIWKVFIPQLGMFAAIAPQQVYHGTINDLCLSVGLWMECRASLQLGIHHAPQAGPKLSKETRVSI